MNPALRLWAARKAAGGLTLSSSYTAPFSSGVDNTTYTSTGLSFGAAASDRIVVVGYGSRGVANAAEPTVTIGGVSATGGAFSGFTGTGNCVGFAWAAVPTGTTGDVVITFTTTQIRLAGAVWRVVGGASSLAIDDTDMVEGFGTTATGLTLTPTTNGGLAFGGLFVVASPSASTWTVLTEDADTQCGAEASRCTYASGTTDGATLSPTVQLGTAGSGQKALTVAYKGVA